MLKLSEESVLHKALGLSSSFAVQDVIKQRTLFQLSPIQPFDSRIKIFAESSGQLQPLLCTFKVIHLVSYLLKNGLHDTDLCICVETIFRAKWQLKVLMVIMQ